MKKYFVKFSRPLLINFEEGKSNYKTIYGFLGNDYSQDPKQIEIEQKFTDDYCSYLCAMHEYSSGKDLFLLSPFGHWIDKNGFEHTWDGWSKRLGNRCRKELKLDYITYVIDTDNVSAHHLGCGIYDGLIIDEKLLNRLVLSSKHQQTREDETQTLYLFNRPIWLPKNSFKGYNEKEHFLIYGVCSNSASDDYYYDAANAYLDYLAVAQEFYLNGETPSGFVAVDEDDFTYWQCNGACYGQTSNELIQEGRICRKKNSLEIIKVVPDTQRKVQANCITGCFLTSKRAYESLLGNK